MREPVLRVEHLTKFYTSFVLRDASFSLSPGSIMGVIGCDGAGKTILLKCLLGLVRPTAGTVRFFGLDQASHVNEIKQRIGYYDAAVSIYPKRKVKDIAGASRRFYEGWDDEAYRRHLKTLDMDPHRSPVQMGETGQAKLNMLMALSHHAELLILDEPTVGLSTAGQAELHECFKNLRRVGVAVLFTTPDTSDLEGCADDITYMRGGRVIASEQLVDFINYRRIRGFGNSLDKIMFHYEREAPREGTVV